MTFENAAEIMQQTIRQDRAAIKKHFESKGLAGQFLEGKTIQEHANLMRAGWGLINGGREASERKGSETGKN